MPHLNKVTSASTRHFKEQNCAVSKLSYIFKGAHLAYSMSDNSLDKKNHKMKMRRTGKAQKVQSLHLIVILPHHHLPAATLDIPYNPPPYTIKYSNAALQYTANLY